MSRMEQADQPVTLQRKVWFQRKGRAKLATETFSRPPQDRSRVPAVARLMALAIRYDQLIAGGHFRDYADLAEFAKVSNARITQIMGLRLLAPDIQEAILFLPRTSSRYDPISERSIRPLVAEPDWARQRTMWEQLLEARV